MGRGLLLDRDGVINVDTGYVHTVDAFTFMPGIFELTRFAVDQGFRLAVVTNQAGIGRGFYSESQFQDLTQWMVAEFSRRGVPLASIFHCPYHNQGRPPYNRQSWWRKPNPGMMREALQRLSLDPAQSMLIGDMETDMQAGKAAGLAKCVLLRAETPESSTIADHVVQNLHDALSLLRAWS